MVVLMKGIQVLAFMDLHPPHGQHYIGWKRHCIIVVIL